MSGSVSFNTIPPNLRIPLVSLEFDPSQAGVGQANRTTLLVGQSEIPQPYVPVPVFSTAQARSLFGRGSMLARMFEIYEDNDNLGTIYCVPVPTATGATPAEAELTVAGSPTAAGNISLYIGGQVVTLGVSPGESATTIAGQLATLCLNYPDLPAIASSQNNPTTYVANHANLVGNQLDMRLNYYGAANGEATPPGLTITITPFTGGTLDPDLTGLDAVLGDTKYDFIVCPYTSPPALAALQAMMSNTTGRWGPLRQVRGHVFAARVDTAANLLAFGATVNDPHHTIFGVYDTPTPPWEIAAATTGTLAPAVRADPARPVQTLQVESMLPPPQASRFGKQAQQSFLTSGVAMLSYDTAGDVYLLRAITTYQTNPYGQPDGSYLDMETLFTLDEVSTRLSIALTNKFGRSKLADDGTTFGPGQPVVTPNIIKAEIIAQYAGMEADGLVEDADAMAQATIVVRNDQDPTRVDILWAPYLISGLRILAIKNQFRLISALAAAA